MLGTGIFIEHISDLSETAGTAFGGMLTEDWLSLVVHRGPCSSEGCRPRISKTFEFRDIPKSHDSIPYHAYSNSKIEASSSHVGVCWRSCGCFAMFGLSFLNKPCSCTDS